MPSVKVTIPLLVAVLAVPEFSQRPALIAGVDHVPVAVRNLDQAADTYRRLGFALKPGAPHANGIRNVHAKFPDGTEIELITAATPVDALTTQYVTHLKQGDGPAFLSLYTPHGRAVAEAIPDEHPARRYIFFGGLNQSPTDRPEHFRHPNTAVALASVWLAAEDFSAEMDLLKRTGVVAKPAMLLFLPASHQIVRGRRIVGATVVVRDLGTTVKVLRAGGLTSWPVASAAGGRSVFVSPAHASGWWLEFRQETR